LFAILQAKLLSRLLDAATGLAYLHKQGVIHGDLKAANVLLQHCVQGSYGQVRAGDLQAPFLGLHSWCTALFPQLQAVQVFWLKWIHQLLGRFGGPS
jgi:hypothetical protein